MGLATEPSTHLTDPHMGTMIVPDATPTGLVGMIHAPIVTMIVVSHDIGRGNREIGQIPTPLPFQDHERVRIPGLLEQPIQAIERVDPDPIPLGGEMLLTPIGDIVVELMVGMKVLAVMNRQKGVKGQTMHCLGLTIDTRLGLLG